MSATQPVPAAPALLSGSSLYLASNLFTAVLALALLPVLTRYLSPSEYGEAAMFTTLVGGLGAVVGLNAVAAISRRYFDGLPDAELARYMAACLQILAVTGVVALAVVLALREPLSRLLGLETRWLAWSVPAAGLAVLIQLRQAQWQVRSQAAPYAALQSGEAVTVTALSLLLVVGLAQGAAGRIGATIASSGLIALLSLVLLRRSGLLRLFAWNPEHVRNALAYGAPLVPHTAAAFVLVAADRLVVTAELGLAQAGIYMLAAHLAQSAALLFDAVNKAYVPWLYERLNAGDAHQQRRIVRATYAWFGALLAGALLAFAIGPWLVRVIAGERYAAAGLVIGWLVLGQVFAGMYLMVTNYVYYARRTGLLSTVTVASGLLNIVLLVILTPRLGIQGAAIAFALAMGVRFLLTWWAAQRSHPMPWFAPRQGSASP